MSNFLDTMNKMKNKPRNEYTVTELFIEISFYVIAFLCAFVIMLGILFFVPASFAGGYEITVPQALFAFSMAIIFGAFALSCIIYTDK